MLRSTPLVRNILIVTVVVFIVQMVMQRYYITEYLALWKPNTNLFRPYQLFTYMFAHGNFSHIFWNMLFFSMLGPYLEMVWGFRRFLFFYLATGIGAAGIYIILELFFNPSPGYMVGASGAIYGMSMAYGLMFPEHELYLFMFPIKAKYFVFVSGFLAYIMDPGGKTAHFAHLGGAIMGFLLVRFGKV